jgi:SAM-dependent methyltransferase
MKAQVAAKRLFSSFESRLLLRRIINFPRDSFDRLAGRRDPLIPPRGLWFVGGERDYKATNEEYMRYFVELGNLRPEHSVLDVGCGIGIMASPLTKFLSPDGSYDGFDIVKVGILWANKHIGSRFPNFRFAHADVFNKHYNAKGRLDPNAFIFPYESGNFDFVFLKSVFTHMRPEGVQHYLREIRRVLKPSGCCLVTSFLLNSESAELIRSGKSSLALTHDLDGYKVLDPKFPETAVGLPEDDLKSWVKGAGLSLQPPVHFGAWCGRQGSRSYQDILILVPSAGN